VTFVSLELSQIAPTRILLKESFARYDGDGFEP
jgi:hypothetical protein